MRFESEISQLNSDMSRVIQRHQYVKQRCETIKQKLVTIEADKADLVKAVALIDKAIEVISASGVGKIESIVTGGLRLAYNDPILGLRVIKNEGKRGNSYALEGYRGEVSGPLDETFGGGVGNVVAFLLRVIMIKRFKLAKVLVVDEAFNNVHPEKGNLLRVSRLLRDLTKNHGYTIIAITGQPVLAAAADRVYRLVPKEGESPTLVHLTDTDLAAMFPGDDDAE